MSRYENKLPAVTAEEKVDFDSTRSWTSLGEGEQSIDEKCVAIINEVENCHSVISYTTYAQTFT